MMRGKTRIYLIGSGVALAGLLALAGCGGIGNWGAERAAWRGEAETECLRSGAVKLNDGVVQMTPIDGPGMCGAEYPLKVSALGEGGSAMSYGDEIRRLRPRMVVAQFRQWTARELDLQREAASASELKENMVAVPGYYVPEIDWRRTARRVLTLEWLDGIKLSDREALIEAGQDCTALAQTLVRAFLRQAVVDGFFHADLHHGNLFALPDGRIAAIDFGIMGRIDRRARNWLAEILYGLITGNYRRVAEIHFEAGYVPPHHNVAEFATALRAVGEPMRGLPVKDMSVGMMLDGLFNITRDFDMQTQPHLLLLQKTMVMVEGVATALDPEINMWDTAAPFVREWIRTELGPEAAIADRIVTDLRTLARLPDLVRRIEARYPAPGGAPPAPPLRDIEVVRLGGGWRYAAVALLSAAIAVAATLVVTGW